MAKGIFDSLLSRLNRVFNKDPKSVTAFKLKASGDARLEIANRRFTITSVGETSPLVSIDLNNPYDASKSITIAQLCDKLNGSKGIVVSDLVTPFSGLGAIAIVEGTYDLTKESWFEVKIATSVLWSIMRPLAYALETARNDVDLAIQQLGFVTAQGDFLDYWGTIFGIPRLSKPVYADGDTEHTTPIRYEVEPDYEYSIRLLWETVKPRLNNKAIENLIQRGVGYDATVKEYSEKVLLGDGMPDPVHTDPDKQYSDTAMVGDGHIDNTTMGFPEDSARYGLGERYNFGHFGVFIDVPIASKYFQYTTQHLEEIVDRHRAAGTTPWFTVTQVAHEVLDVVDKTLEMVEGAIDQQLEAGRVMFFGHDDEQFYGDHWSKDNVAKAPWLQNNLEIPSLGDGVVVQSKKTIVPPVMEYKVESEVLDGSLGDGFKGGFNKNLLVGDGGGLGDDVNFVNHTKETEIEPAKEVYENDPVVLSYQRVSDEYTRPRIVETLGDDVMVKQTSSIAGVVAAWAGSGAKVNVLDSDSVMITSPISVIAPTSILGLSIDTLALMLENLHDIPTIIRNVEAPYLGDNWDKDFADFRNIIVPYQDEYGNVYTHTIQVPVSSPPPPPTLRIANPTASIDAIDPSNNTLPKVQTALGGQVTIRWAVTNASAARLWRINNDNEAILEADRVVGYSGAITFSPTVNTRYEIRGTGNNGQMAVASIVVAVVSNPLTVDAPSITAVAKPSVVELCDTNQTVISYRVDFNDNVTEEQTLAWPDDSNYIDLTPLATDPDGTVFNTRTPIVTRVADDSPVNGAWEGFGTGVARFYTTDDIDAGTLIKINYDVNYGSNQLYFNGVLRDIPMEGVETIEEAATVILPGPNYNNPNLCFNGDFESGNSYWGVNGTTLKVVTDPTKAYKGSNYYLLTGDNVSSSLMADAAASQSLYIPVEEGDTVVISAKVYRESGTGGNVNISLSVVDGNKANPSYAGGNGITALKNWYTSELQYVVPAGKKFISPYLQCWGCSGGTVARFDQIYVSKTTKTYTVNYEIKAVNAAGTRILSVPVYVQPIKQGSGKFQVTNLSPSHVPEAIGPTANETVPVTITGSGFSSKMEVWLRKPTSDGTSTQLVQAAVTNVDWQNGSLTFIAPRFEMGSYPVRVVKLDCNENVMAMDETFALVYDESTFRHPPFIASLQPEYVCVSAGFVSKAITVTGVNFRSGAVVYMVKKTGPVAKTTRFINENTLSFDMDESTYGTYDLIVINTDTSQGVATQMLRVMDANQPPTINQFGYVKPSTGGNCALYGKPFNLYWNCSDTSKVTFTSNDASVQTALAGDWGRDGSVSLVIPAKGTTITLRSENECGNVRTQLITFTEEQCYHTADIRIQPNPVVINKKEPFGLTVLRNVVNDSTGDAHFEDITKDPSLVLTLVDDKGNAVTTDKVTLTTNFLNPIKNGVAAVKAEWNGYTAIAPISIQMPYPVALDVTPVELDYHQTGLQQQLTAVALYSDGTKRDVTQVAKYSDYSSIITVNRGLVNFVSLGYTTIRVSYYDSVQPESVVEDTVIVNGKDACLKINRSYVNPPFVYAYTGQSTPGSTIVKTVGGIGMSKIHGRFYKGGDFGDFRVYAGQTPDYEQDFNSLIFNPPVGYITNSEYYATKDTRPFTNVEVNDNGVAVAAVPVSGVGQSIWLFNGLYNFQAVFTGTFYVEKAGYINFRGLVDDGFWVGIGNGAQRISGPWESAVQNTSRFNGYPLMAVVNCGGGPRAKDFTVYFPNPGEYPFEIAYVEGHGGELCFALLANNAPIRKGETIVVPPVVDPAKGSSATLTINAQNIRTASVDGTAVLNQDILSTWNYTKTDVLSEARIYTVVLANADSRLQLKTIGNVLKMGAPSITKFTAYDADQPTVAETIGPLNVEYASGVGLCWNAQDALEVTITEITNTSLQVNVDGKSGPWIAAGVNADKPYGNSTCTAPTPVALPLKEGMVVSVTATGTVKAGTNWAYVDANGGGIITGTQLGSSGRGFPTKYMGSTNLGLTGLCGAFVDATGKVVQAVAIGTSATLTVPAGAVALQLGINDDYFSDNLGAFQATVAIQSDTTVVTKVANAGTRLVMPTVTTTYRLTATGVFGSKVTKDIQVNVALPTSETQKTVVVDPKVVQLGQSANVKFDGYTLPDAYTRIFRRTKYPYTYWGQWERSIERAVTSTGLHAYTDNRISPDGSRPVQQDSVLAEGPNVVQQTAFPTANTLFRFEAKVTVTVNYYGWDYYWWYDGYRYEGDYYGWRGYEYERWVDEYTYEDAIDYYASGVVNVDAGAKFVSASASVPRVKVGDPVTIAWETTGAVQVTGDFVGGQNLPLGKASFTIYPDVTRDYKITAISETGLSTTQTIHVEVEPQVMSAVCSNLPKPSVQTVYIDGLKGGSVDEIEAVHMLEIYGSGFVGGRALTPEVVGAVHVSFIKQTLSWATTNGIMYPYDPEAPILARMEVVEMAAVSDTYIRCKVRIHPFTSAGRYFVTVQNDVGMSGERTTDTSFAVDVTIPKFTNADTVTGHSGDQYTLYIDQYDAGRDAGLQIVVGGSAVNPISIGGADANGVPVKVVLTASGTVGIGLQTGNGISSVHKTFVPVPLPPAPPAAPANPTIYYTSVGFAAPTATVEVFGANFTADCKVYLGSALCTTTYVNGGHLSFVVPALANASYVVTVTNSVGTGSFMSFEVRAAIITPPIRVVPDYEPLPLPPAGKYVGDYTYYYPDRYAGFVSDSPEVVYQPAPAPTIQTVSVNDEPVQDFVATIDKANAYDAAYSRGGWE